MKGAFDRLSKLSKGQSQGGMNISTSH
jgi:hypothetical protein